MFLRKRRSLTISYRKYFPGPWNYELSLWQFSLSSDGVSDSNNEAINVVCENKFYRQIASTAQHTGHRYSEVLKFPAI